MEPHVKLKRGPLRLDGHMSGKLQPSTHNQYRRCIAPFIKWLLKNRYYPDLACEYDDLLVEYKTEVVLSKAKFEGLVAGIEFILLHFRGQLVWTRSVLAGWSTTHVAHHIVPLVKGPAYLVSCHIAAMGHERMACGILLQHALGLRPSEPLGIVREDVMLPDDLSADSNQQCAVIGLGMKAGTKAKRAQAVMLRSGRLIGILKWLWHTCLPGQRIIGYNYEQYRRLLKRAEEALRISVGYTPHSARAGFATDMRVGGVSFTDIREAGRWVADTSLRVYLDVMGAAQISTNLKLVGLSNAQAYALRNVLDYLSAAKQYVPDCYHHDIDCHCLQSYAIARTSGDSLAQGRTGAPVVSSHSGGHATTRNLSVRGQVPPTVGRDKVRQETRGLSQPGSSSSEDLDTTAIVTDEENEAGLRKSVTFAFQKHGTHHSSFGQGVFKNRYQRGRGRGRNSAQHR